jgi:hypothetical protein
MNRADGIFSMVTLCVALAACGGSGGNGGTPTLTVASNTASFSAVAGFGTDLFPVKDHVTISGGNSAAFTATSDSPWLAVTPANGSAPQDLSISVTLGAMTANTYTGHVTVTAMGALGSPATVTVTFVVAPAQASNTPFWPQWGSNPQHTGMVSVAGQHLTNKLVDITYDPFIDQEKAEFGGELVVHEQSPIVDGNDVYMVQKSGTYNSCNPAGDWQNGAACGPNTWNTMIWNERRFSWVNGQLVQAWTFQSDWVPEPNAANFNLGIDGLAGWEPVFHPVEANNFIYVPGGAGTVWKVDKTAGTASHINPFNGVSGVTAANTFVSGPLSADSNGNVYYNVIELNLAGGDPWSTNDVVNAWLVKITSAGATSTVTFATLVPGAPAGSATDCPGRFFGAGTLPWPPAVNAVPATEPCGSQRPGVNLAPAMAADGTIYTASRAHFDERVTYLIAVNPNLTVKWAASMQNRLNDGCGNGPGFIVPIGPTNSSPNACRVGTNSGVDPTTNAPGSGSLIDQASSSPTVLPDDSIVLGTTTDYNGARGHLLHFDNNGNFLNAYDFGWDSTPGVYAHGSTFSIVIKDNHYNTNGLYCSANSPTCQPLPPGPYYITQLDPNLNIEWQFQSTTIDNTHPNGYEWCINMPAIDSDGNVFVNSEDGNIYVLLQPQPVPPSKIITQPGGKLFLDVALGAAYTPLAIGPDGKLYTQNNGHLIVVGN